MKKAILLTLISAASAVALDTASPDVTQLQAFPKNLARQHMGANLFQYSSTTQGYTPTPAAAAWLDDDITTCWSMMSGKQYYMIAFPEAELISNFSVSAKPSPGTISLYVSNEAAPPGAKAWSTLAKDVPFESVNEKKSANAFARTAKYLLIETNLTDPGPVYSLYVYGNHPAVAYGIQGREQSIDTKSVFGPYENDSTAFSVSSLYAHSYAAPVGAQGSFAEAQKAIDDNPESSVTLGGGQSSLLEIHTSEPRTISRVAMEVSAGAKGRFEFFLLNGEAAPAPNAVPAATLVLDGSTSRASVDFAGAPTTTLQARWTPANGTDAVSVQELNAFSGVSLASNMVSTDLRADAIAEDDTERKSGRSRRDGKEIADYKDAKDAKSDPPPVGEFQAGPYLPGALGFPPVLTARAVRTPNEPVSP